MFNSDKVEGGKEVQMKKYGEEGESRREDASSLTDLHVKVMRAQKREMERYCFLLKKSQSEIVREALTVLFSFYNRADQGDKGGK